VFEDSIFEAKAKASGLQQGQRYLRPRSRPVIFVMKDMVKYGLHKGCEIHRLTAATIMAVF